MGRKGLLCFLMMIILSISACNSDSLWYKEMKASEDYILPIEEANKMDIQVEENIFKFEPIYKDKYKVEKLKIEGVESPNGILCREQDMLITDSGNNIIVVADFDGNVLRTIGKTGNGSLEFMSPGNMVRYENKIYIIDEKNHRVQILDENLNYIEEIKTKRFDQYDPDFVYRNIAVNKHGIYLNGFSFTNDQIHLYASGIMEPIKIGKNFCGPLFNYQEKIYASNMLSKVYDKKADSMSYRTGGSNYLFIVKDEKKDFALNCEIMPATDAVDFLITENGIVVLSATNSSLFAFDTEGNYTSTIAILDGLTSEFPKFSANSAGIYYVADSDSKTVFRCLREE